MEGFSSNDHGETSNNNNNDNDNNHRSVVVFEKDWSKFFEYVINLLS
jgi:hypothetical protein